jgi:DNA-binding NarL/FixJ family response regulator
VPILSRQILGDHGLTNAEVGERLFISYRTVGRHLQSIYNKLGVNSRTAATAFAFEHGLV